MSGLINRDDVRKAILDEFDGDIRYTMTTDEFLSNVLRVVDSVKAADEIEIANAYWAVPEEGKPDDLERCRYCQYFTGERHRSPTTGVVGYYNSCSNDKSGRRDTCPSSYKCKQFQKRTREANV